MAESRKVYGTAAEYSRNAVIAEKNVVAKIVDWDYTNEPETIRIKFEVLSGSKKGGNASDTVTWAKDNKFNWKYGKVRQAINRPIPKDVIDEFDLIELLDQIVLIDLVPSKDGRYQNVAYKDYFEETIQTILAEEAELETNLTTEIEPNQGEASETKETSTNAETALDVEDDLPF